MLERLVLVCLRHHVLSSANFGKFQSAYKGQFRADSTRLNSTQLAVELISLSWVGLGCKRIQSALCALNTLRRSRQHSTETALLEDLISVYSAADDKQTTVFVGLAAVDTCSHPRSLTCYLLTQLHKYLLTLLWPEGRMEGETHRDKSLPTFLSPAYANTCIFFVRSYDIVCQCFLYYVCG